MPLPLPNWEDDFNSAPVIPPPPPPKPSKRQSYRTEPPMNLYKPNRRANVREDRTTRYNGRPDHMGSRDRRRRHAENEECTAFSGLSLGPNHRLTSYPPDDSPSGANLPTASGRPENSAAIKLQLLNGVKFRDAPPVSKAVFVHDNNHSQALQTPEIVNGTPPNDVVYPRAPVPNADQPIKPSQHVGPVKKRRHSPKNLELYPKHIAQAMAATELQPHPMTRYLCEQFPERALLLEKPTIVELARGPRGKALRPNIYGPPVRDPGILVNNGQNGSDWRPYNPHPAHYGAPKSKGFASGLFHRDMSRFHR